MANGTIGSQVVGWHPAAKGVCRPVRIMAIVPAASGG
jgi:hypothetical protein